MENQELLEALNALEKEKNISKDAILDAIESSLLTACKNHFKTNDGRELENARVVVDHETCGYQVFLDKTVVEEVTDPQTQISLNDACMKYGNYNIGDVVSEPVDSKSFGRIATQNAKNVILQKLREEERNSLFDQYSDQMHQVVTGVVQRMAGDDVILNLGKADGSLRKSEQEKGETYKNGDRIKVYVLDVRNGNRGPKIMVSRTHPELVRKLFETEVAEVKDGIVEIKSIAREAGSRTKMAVWSNDENVDPVGACVGLNGSRVNAVVKELHGEKIDIINWNENPAMLIENALRPAKVIYVIADEDERSAKVVVQDSQLSLAIGKEGQNARLAARLTGFKIDIKSETQAKESGEFIGYDEADYNYDDEYYEDGEYEEGEYEDGEYYEEGEYEDGEYYEEGEYEEGAQEEGNEEE